MEPYVKTLTSRPRCVIQHSAIPGTPVVSYSGVVNSDSSLYGFKNPEWRSAVKQHIGATTPCSGSSRVFNPGYYYATQVRKEIPSGTISRRAGFGAIDLQMVNHLAVSTVGVDNAALMRFYKAVNGVLNQSSGLIFLAELRDTVRQLKHPFRSLVSLLSRRETKLKGAWNRAHKVTTRSLRKKRIRDFQKASADTWLEVQFGLSPLVSDIEDTVSYLQQRRFQIGVEYYPVKGIFTRRSSSIVPFTLESGNTGLGFSAVKRTETSYTVRYIGEVKVDPLNTWVDWRDFRNLGFSLRQFGPALWEVTPWSFLLDYFLPVGDLIESFNVPRESVAWINKTVRTHSVANVVRTGKSVGQVSPSFTVTPEYIEVSLPSTNRRTDFTRSLIVPSLLPRPSISLELPSGRQFVNILALCQSNSRRLFSSS